MNTLREGMAELNKLKDIVEQRKLKIKRGKIIKEEVKHWLSRVNIINEGLQDVEKSCSAGSRCPLAKASLGKTILGKIGEVEKLIREHGSFSGDIVIDGPSTSGAKKKLKHALDRLNRLNSQKEKVETQKSRHENAGEVVREEVNDWLIEVRSINKVFQILKGASRRVSRCNKLEVNEIVLKKSDAVNILLQRGTFPDGL
ncbi:hypothetical protein SLEP1_g23797 [Rubroshorea leprosula]|uniref:Uncharacterized protein n=1 Tax=Rubroshorea leprosula TaxID=152421 RepID=A0AAV5JM91_9ROSI|nr:hypothetical protein SLEP1_g23797 [Rubroshorea leprosula]